MPPLSRSRSVVQTPNTREAPFAPGRSSRRSSACRPQDRSARLGLEQGVVQTLRRLGDSLRHRVMAALRLFQRLRQVGFRCRDRAEPVPRLCADQVGAEPFNERVAQFLSWRSSPAGSSTSSQACLQADGAGDRAAVAFGSTEARCAVNSCAVA